jgi:hypothetical protein
MPAQPPRRPRKPTAQGTARPAPSPRKPPQPAPGEPTAGRRKPPKPAPGGPTARTPRQRRSGSGQPTGRRPERPRPVPDPDPTHFANRSDWSKKAACAWRSTLTALAAAVAQARAAGRWGLALAAGELGRRVARAVALIVALAVVVVVLYDQGEVPTAAATPGLAAPAARPAEAGGPALHKDPGDRGGLRGRARPGRVGERPADVAAAWYAARNRVPRAKVKPLQQDRLSATAVRVLVLADHGHGRLRTALVRLRLGPDGWRVR